MSAIGQLYVGTIYQEKKPANSLLNNKKPMEFIHTYKNKTTFASPPTSFQDIFLTFIQKNARVFKALARGGTPYGGNWLPENTQSMKVNRLTPREQLAAVQQQIGELSQTVNQLSDQLNPRNVSSRKTHNPSEAADEIGINRFRALQANS